MAAAKAWGVVCSAGAANPVPIRGEAVPAGLALQQQLLSCCFCCLSESQQFKMYD